MFYITIKDEIASNIDLPQRMRTSDFFLLYFHPDVLYSLMQAENISTVD